MPDALTPAKADETTDLREALELGPVPPKSLAELRRTVRDCIGETIPLRRRWVSAIMERVVGPLAQREAAHAAESHALRAEIEKQRQIREQWVAVAADNAKAADRLAAENAVLTTPRPIAEYHEDHGFVLWWILPVCEPPYSGSPLCDDWPDYHTHWTSLPKIQDAAWREAQEADSRAARAALPEATIPKETSDAE